MDIVSTVAFWALALLELLSRLQLAFTFSPFVTDIGTSLITRAKRQFTSIRDNIYRGIEPRPAYPFGTYYFTLVAERSALPRQVCEYFPFFTRFLLSVFT